MPAEGDEMQSPASALPHITADIVERLRERRPRVHCITNSVTQAFTANVLLAAGVIPSMTLAVDEVADFVADAQALLINLGTLDADRREACSMALTVAGAASIPWVLDPVFIDRSGPRAHFADELVTQEPRAIRLNAAEFATLAGVKADEGALERYAREMSTVVGLTGAVDLVSDGDGRIAKISNGHPLMTLVTGMGCAGSALVAACLAVEPDAWQATGAALIMLGVAGEVAADQTQAPGRFALEIVDALYGLDRATLVARAKVA
jgi:hydroxyethylthiazole kinase